MKADATHLRPHASPGIPALEAELGLLRLKVAQRRRVIAELRGCLDDLGFAGLSWPARLASSAGFITGVVATAGAVWLACRLIAG